ncbi:hypothetical protein WL83_26960 [Burkholderia ubonensis]|nr:hypothetical protein WL83_26960 [Burkholderia ubonensis]
MFQQRREASQVRKHGGQRRTGGVSIEQFVTQCEAVRVERGDGRIGQQVEIFGVRLQESKQAFDALCFRCGRNGRS